MTEIVVQGVVAPYQWSGSNFYSSVVPDVGIFAPTGTPLAGDALTVVWNDNPVTAGLTINGVTVEFAAMAPFVPYTVMRADYQNITVATFNPYNDLVDNIAINSYSPAFAAQMATPLGLQGSWEMCLPVSCLGSAGAVPLDGFFYVSSMRELVPGPVLGEGLIPVAVIVLALLYMRLWGKWAKR